MKFYSLSILLFLSISIFAQDKKQDWIKINNEIVYGLIEYSDSNFSPEAISFKREGQNEFVKYTPESISEFYLHPINKTFVKKTTTENRTLFFALQKDPNWLLLYEKDKVYKYVDIGDSMVYQLDEKGNLKEKIKKEKLENFLLKYYNKDDYPFRLANGKPKKLAKIFPKNGVIKKNRIGFFKLGLLGGIGTGIYSDNFLEVLYSPETKYNRMVLGGFAELPLYASGKLSLLLESRWSKFQYTNSKDERKEHKDFFVSYQQIEVPIILRYYVLNRNLSPYLNIGLHSYHGFNIENKFYTSNLETPGTIFISEFIPEENLTNTSDYSILLGVGGRYFINHRSAIYTEIRFVNSMGLNTTNYEIRKREIEFLLGFSF